MCNPHLLLGKRLSVNVTAAIHTDEKKLRTTLAILVMSWRKKVGEHFFPEILVIYITVVIWEELRELFQSHVRQFQGKEKVKNTNIKTHNIYTKFVL
jgi:hypothetical protein